ncbi:glutamyl-Q tRNA(Asp) synthetase [Arboricoccus pini]|uniref:Glutamyl-Q tRNA(Asp) synthetase n=1 Tax=Arboricoccus pini TaxID=1963835 RepID=A0A212QTJ4_9PROT|nr:tRNA glutamyl-Q(34) synthetase GluQRS [Arboricoccus pini]SNB62935.1 glutamyl-Q tRNA(Asp) synthetase [Arboricoccus pini]
MKGSDHDPACAITHSTASHGLRMVLEESVLKGQDFIPLIEGGQQPFVTRFAPSPTGLLHIGHAYAALFAFETARLSHGRFHVRIEDIDQQRCREEFDRATLEDILWLGLKWDGEVVRQSKRLNVYCAALEALKQEDVLYPCFCSRRQIRVEIEDAARAPHGPSGEPVYPGTCRNLDREEALYRIARGEPYCWRLDVAKAVRRTGPLHWLDMRAQWIEATPELLGDVVLSRKDIPTSYHLAVVVDDAMQGVNLVTRGEDLFHATHVHRLLQALLGLTPPAYYHHNLVADSTGQRLAKRNRAVTLRHLRDSHRTPDDIWRMIGLQGPMQALSA